MDYNKAFDPERMEAFGDEMGGGGDARGRSVYVYTDEIILAVNIALATGRPLLVRGPSGGGKSSLARNVAHCLRRTYYERVISSSTQARDVLWEVNLLRRLQDAQANALSEDDRYVQPGVLWKAFDPASAAQQEACYLRRTPDPAPPTGNGTVVLFDEVDKADPDFPNNLLVPLGSLRFRCEETQETVEASSPPLIFITTNDERDLPPAFLRRCVELRLKATTREQLVEVGQAHFSDADEALLSGVAELLTGDQLGGGVSPSAAEYLDTVRACVELGVRPESPLWDDLTNITIWKHGRIRPGITP